MFDGTDYGSLPECRCVRCGRKVKTIMVVDGTVYKPFAWSFPYPDRPLDGVCPRCQDQLDGW